MLNLINNEVFEPALASDIDASFKKTLRRTRTKISHFNKPGDLYRYFTKVLHTGDVDGGKLYKELRQLGLKTFEDTLPLINEQFHDCLHDTTELDDLVEGSIYTKIQICCLANNFNQFSGMWEVRFGNVCEGIIASIKMGGEDYNNSWIVLDQKLKYYPQKIEGKGESRVSLSAVTMKDVPFYIFINEGDNQYTYNGKFLKTGDEYESEGYLILERITGNEKLSPVKLEDYQFDFARTAKEAMPLGLLELTKRLEAWEEVPREKFILVKQYNRNPYVKGFSLLRAKGICERCEKDAPFLKKDSTPYLEVHHLIQLAHHGEDTINNTIALCPTCHRELHFGRIVSSEVVLLQMKIIKKNIEELKAKM